MGGADGTRRGPRTRTVLLAVLLCLLAAAGVGTGLGVAGRLPGDGADEPSPRPSRTTTTAAPQPAPAPAVLVPAGADGASARGVPVRRLARLLGSPAFRSTPKALVLDESTGETVFARVPAVAAVPASTSKLVTCTAALLAMGGDTRLTTSVVEGAAPNEIVLVGAGDASLTTRPATADAGELRPASLSRLANRTAARLRASGATTVLLRIDDSLFAGPAVSPDWEPGYVAAGVVSPVSALSVDSGRVSPDSSARETDPAMAAGADFASMLQARGVGVRGPVTRATAPAGATLIADVRSPTVADLVTKTLTVSDNDLAEALARLAASASNRPATFAGAQQTLTDTVAGLGLPAAGLRLLDGSGLSRGSRIAPVTLAALIRLAVGDSRLGPVVAGLPVGAFSGSLSERFDEIGTRPGAGLVRAKTGTLTGVSGLAGIADDGTGRPLVFVVLADRVMPAGTLEAREALDRFAATLAR